MCLSVCLHIMSLFCVPITRRRLSLMPFLHDTTLHDILHFISLLTVRTRTSIYYTLLQQDLTLAERLTWANSVAWALLFFTTMLRYWIAKRNDAKSDELSVSADDKTLFGDETDA